MHLPALLYAAQGLGALASSQYILSKPHCHDFDVSTTVQRTAEHSFVNRDYDADVLISLANKEILVSNTYQMSSRLCEPSRDNAHSDTLQLLIHGASFNKNMWESQYEPETYNWVQRMNREGYYTLAVDLIGIKILPGSSDGCKIY